MKTGFGRAGSRNSAESTPKRFTPNHTESAKGRAGRDPRSPRNLGSATRATNCRRAAPRFGWKPRWCATRPSRSAAGRPHARGKGTPCVPDDADSAGGGSGNRASRGLPTDSARRIRIRRDLWSRSPQAQLPLPGSRPAAGRPTGRAERSGRVVSVARPQGSARGLHALSLDFDVGPLLEQLNGRAEIFVALAVGDARSEKLMHQRR